MKVLFIKSNIHHKNLHFILKCKQLTFHIINNASEIVNLNLSEFDAVYSPCQPIDVSKYPNTKFIFGPHFSVFPNQEQMNMIKGENSIYIQPSDWSEKVWTNSSVCNGIKIVPFSFGVDTNKFNEINSINSRTKVFVYFKRRRPDEIDALLSFLKSKNIEIEIFDYEKKYSEEKYLNYLQNSKYGIWLDAHESQGFALEEALSCNVPLLVWNVSSMNQEYRSSYNNIPATTIPYWDARCGEYFYNVDELEETFTKFLSNINTYKPREYILENLSIDVCEQKLIDIIKNI
jgi:hypothetical protein